MQRMKKGIKVAIIDDGVNETMDSVFSKISRCYVEKGRLYQGTVEQIPPLTHGTICAAVIASKETDIELFDIRIFKGGSADMEDLITALEYCMSCGVQVINLSCGTLNYLEYKKVERTLHKLLRKKIMVVSALSNQGIMSFPASCRGVFGVRTDFGKCLKRGEYGFQKFTGGRLENSIVAHIGTVTIDGSKLDAMANSYAAPVVTGEIIGILKNGQGCSFKSILRQMILRGAREGCLGRDPKKYLSCRGKEISTPVLGIDRRCGQLKKYIKERLQADGYHVITVCENARNGKEIPCVCYMDRKQMLDRDIIYTVEHIYEPDIILFFLNKKRFRADTVLDIIDIHISKMWGRIELKSEEDIFVSGDCQKIYEYVLDFFSDHGV